MTDEKDKPGDEIEFIPEPPPEAGPAPAPPADEARKDAGERPHHGEGQKALKEKLKKKEADLKHLKKELDELKDQCLRRLAEMENLRKRFEREKHEYTQFALSGFLLELLAIVDNFERALQSAPAEADGKTFREGVELIYRLLQAVLAKHGVQPIVFADKAFNPNLQHAMSMEESEGVEEPTVELELQKGYLHHQRLLRPAMVKVLVPKKGQ